MLTVSQKTQVVGEAEAARERRDDTRLILTEYHRMLTHHS